MKYNVEGNIDFYQELYKSLDDGEEELNQEENQNLCLITNQPLTTHFIKLDCGHTFNYLPLYYDIYNHKKKFNSMETTSGHLKADEIRCPYCRNKQKGVLPYYEEWGLEKVDGVNTISEIKWSKDIDYSTKCEYLTENPKFNSELSDSSMNKKLFSCYSYGSKITEANNYNDKKYYCYYHKKMVVSNYKKEEKEKVKKEKEAAKIKEKNEKINAKEEIKKQKEQEKGDKKNSSKQQDTQSNKIQELMGEMEEENTVMTAGCCEILKMGLNKGNACNQKIFQEGRCKRHFQKNGNMKGTEKIV
jgi:hypothetical protein